MRFLVLTNNSIYTPRDLSARLRAAASTCPRRRSGRRPWPRRGSCGDQRPGGTAYVIGEAGLTTALHEVGYMLTERDPDYVVLGETRTYCFEAITRAIRLIRAAPGSSPPTPTPSGRRPRARCPPPARSPR